MALAILVGGSIVDAKSAWAYDETGTLLWSYYTGGQVRGVAIDPNNDYVYLVGQRVDNGDGNGYRTLWQLDKAGNYIDGVDIGTFSFGVSVDPTDGRVGQCAGSAGLNVLDPSDLSVLHTGTGSVTVCSVFDDDGNVYYAYASGNFHFMRALDATYTEVFKNSIITSDSDNIYGMHMGSDGKVVVFSPQEEIVRRVPADGAGGWGGDWEKVFGWAGAVSTYQHSVAVDQGNSDKIYACAPKIGSLTYAGDLVAEILPPAYAPLYAIVPWGSSVDECLFFTSYEDGAELYSWDTDDSRAVALCSWGLGVQPYDMVVVPDTDWGFAVKEELAANLTDNSTLVIGATNWQAQTFTLTDYKKPVRCGLILGRNNTGTVTVAIQGVDGNNKPDGVDLCSGTYTQVNNAGTWWSQVFFDTNPILPPGTYAIVVSATQSSTVGRDTTAPHAGDLWTSSDGGSSWGAGSGDLTFDLWGDVSGYTLPSFDSQSGNQNLYVDQTPIPLSVTVSGNPTPTLQWYGDGSPLSGETGSTYAPPAQSEAKSISYICRATNLVGPVDSTPMVVTWQELPPPADPVTYNILNLQLDLDRS